MQLDKSQILGLLRSQGDHSTADRAEGELPDSVDTDQHASTLAQLGLNPQDLIAKLTGGDAGQAGLSGLLGR